MTEIFLDPDQLNTVAAMLRTVQNELADLAGGVRASCCCDLPAGVSGYIDAELGGVAAGVSEAANGYALAAADLSARAGLVTADQSMAGAMSAAYTAPAAAYAVPAPVSGATAAEAGPAGTNWSFGDSWMGDMAANNAAPSIINTSGWAAQIHGVTAAPAAALGTQGLLNNSFNQAFGGQAVYSSGVAAASESALLNGHGFVRHEGPGLDTAAPGLNVQYFSPLS